MRNVDGQKEFEELLGAVSCLNQDRLSEFDHIVTGSVVPPSYATPAGSIYGCGAVRSASGEGVIVMEDYGEVVDALALWEAGSVRDAASQRIHELVTKKLGGDTAFDALQSEVARHGAVSSRTRARLILGLEEAVEQDPSFHVDLDKAASLVNLATNLGTTFNSTGGASIQVGSISGNVTVHLPHEDGPLEDKDDLANSRQSFLFKFYEQALRQADITFRMSLIAMSVGVLIVLSAGVLALVNFGFSNHGSLALVTGLSGILVSSCGGAFAIHANRARKHLTSQAVRMEGDLQADRKLAQTLRLINQIGDLDLRDRLMSVTAMQVIALRPDPDSVTDHLLARPGEPTSKRASAKREDRP